MPSPPDWSDATALEPCGPAPVASINRTRLGDRDARDLLSAPALAELAAGAGLRPVGPLRTYLDRRLAAGDPAAASVAATYGDRLGTLLATLRAGNRRTRPEWDESWWRWWTGTTTIRLGGGLAGGAFGALASARAAALVGPGCRVVVAPEPADLPLAGAARTAARPDGPALVLDFGHTLVKRAVVAPLPTPAGGPAGPHPSSAPAAPAGRGATAGGTATAGRAASAGEFGGRAASAGEAGGRAAPVPAAPVDRAAEAGAGPAGGAPVLRRMRSVGAPPDDLDGAALAAAVAGIVAAAWADAGRPAGPVVASMAAYLRDGQPYRTPLGLYTRLADVGPDVPARLRELVGQDLHVVLLHDGTAAAHAVPPDPRSVVVLLGSSIGVGFPHPCPGLGAA